MDKETWTIIASVVASTATVLAAIKWTSHLILSEEVVIILKRRKADLLTLMDEHFKERKTEVDAAIFLGRETAQTVKGVGTLMAEHDEQLRMQATLVPLMERQIKILDQLTASIEESRRVNGKNFDSINAATNLQNVEIGKIQTSVRYLEKGSK